MNKPTREKARIRDSGHSNSRIGSGGSVGRGAFRTGNSEWREFGDPATFANEEVCVISCLSYFGIWNVCYCITVTALVH